jgi:uncharacterized repeat protein (TIGR03803 family)
MPMKPSCEKAVFALWLLFAAAVSPAQTFTNLLDFNFTDGAAPESTLIQATDGNLYGYTTEGGLDVCAGSCGTLFKIDHQGKLTTFYKFCRGGKLPCPDGMTPNGALIQASDGNFYGTTMQGGPNNGPNCQYGCGTVFRITPEGKLTTLYSFCALANCADGASPEGALLQASNGKLYGETGIGGNGVQFGMGTLFELTLQGKLTTVHTFCANYPDCSDGIGPTFGLIQARNGNLYGTTAQGGGIVNDRTLLYGTVFEIKLDGTLTSVYSFCLSGYPTCPDGEYPVGQLVQAADGNLYGATNQGGTGHFGTIFKMAPSGQLTTIHTFQGTDGGFPAGIMQASNDAFYGSTDYEGANGDGGTLFLLNSTGFTTLYNFCSQTNCPDGSGPSVLTQGTDGILYGTTVEGGNLNFCFGGCGTLFSLNDGLHAFVEANPDFGKAGRKVILLGTNLTGTSSVSFHGTPATFKIVSKSEVITTVPAGATSGKIKVTTPGGTLTSNVKFRVTH